MAILNLHFCSPYIEPGLSVPVQSFFYQWHDRCPALHGVVVKSGTREREMEMDLSMIIILWTSTHSAITLQANDSTNCGLCIIATLKTTSSSGIPQQNYHFSKSTIQSPPAIQSPLAIQSPPSQPPPCYQSPPVTTSASTLLSSLLQPASMHPAIQYTSTLLSNSLSTHPTSRYQP